MLIAGRPLTPELEGRRTDPSWQWWCVYAHLDRGDGHTWSVYFWPSVSEHSDSLIASVHRDGELVDLSSFPLAPGTIGTADRGVDVEVDACWFRGSYPTYRLHLESVALSLDLCLRAQGRAYEALAKTRGISWLYLPHVTVEGEVTVGGGRPSAVVGKAYVERRRGRFWSPGVSQGIWETFPAGSATAAALPMFYELRRNDGSPAFAVVAVAVEGAVVELDHVEVEVFESATAHGIDHPMTFRVSAEGPEGELDALVVRSPGRLELCDFLAEPRAGARSFGVYGPGEIDGYLRHAGGRVRVAGPTFGSSLRFWQDALGPSP